MAEYASCAANTEPKARAPKSKHVGAQSLLHRTKSICPECKLVVDAEIFEKNSEAWIAKKCPRHGIVSDKYWEDVDMWRKATKYSFAGQGAKAPNVEYKGELCPIDCGLCSRHKSHTALANIAITNRCHLSCWYCFFYAKEGMQVYEPSLELIDRMLLALRAERPIPCNAIQFTGGEPCLREDLPEIIALAKKRGFSHVQLNTTGIQFMQQPGLARKVRQAGCATLYMSFDGATARTNPKNHWEAPYALDACRNEGIGIVLVPTVIRTINDHELGDIINFGLNNLDVVRSVNFQPVSLVGRMPTKQRLAQRITIPGAVKLIEEQTNGTIARDDWFSVPCTGAISRFAEALTGKSQYELSTHPACGAGTYVFLDDDKVIPLPRFVNVEGLLEHLEDSAQEIRKGGSKTLASAKLLLNLGRFIDKNKAPKSFDVLKLLVNGIVKHNYAALGEFHKKSLFLGMMHFQDCYNYDVERVEKCTVHYAMPDGRVIPFCAFNVMPEIYRDKVQAQYGYTPQQWRELRPGWEYAQEKYVRDSKALSSGEAYARHYKHSKNYFATRATK